jgi:hypothetical protein
MKRSALITLWLGAAVVAAFAQAPVKPGALTGPDNKRLILQVENIAPNGTAILFGDPSKPGTYIVRTKLAPSTKTRPRFYDQDRWVTVLKGTWWVGEGEVFRPEKVVPVREGGVMHQPANMRTFDITGASEVILQIVGNGPVRTTHAEVTAAGIPVPIGGPFPEDAAEESGGRYGRNRGRRGAPPPPPVDPDQTPPSNPQLLKEQQQPQ